jgi:hypothetical protein
VHVTSEARGTGVQAAEGDVCHVSISNPTKVFPSHSLCTGNVYPFPHTSALSIAEIVARLTACRLAVGAVGARDGHRVADYRAGCTAPVVLKYGVAIAHP